MQANTIKTANNGGCGECACHCHSDKPAIPAGHIESCKFADPTYVPPDFAPRALAILASVAATRSESEGP